MNLIRLEEPRALERAISLIQHGGVIAFPTDTVYGIGASIKHPDALERIYQIKGRERSRALPLLLSSPIDIPTVARDVDPRLIELAREFWPGPLTIAVPAIDGLPAPVVAEDGTVGVRVPDHSVALTIANRCGGAIAATSANLSGQSPACTADEIQETLGDALDLILDGGFAPCGLASTVVRLARDTISIVRPGAIPEESVHAAWERVLEADRATLHNA